MIPLILLPAILMSPGVLGIPGSPSPLSARNAGGASPAMDDNPLPKGLD